eukprot:739936_1
MAFNTLIVLILYVITQLQSTHTNNEKMRRLKSQSRESVESRISDSSSSDEILTALPTNKPSVLPSIGPSISSVSPTNGPVHSVDCVLGTWNVISETECGEQTRTRSIQIEPIGKGKECDSLQDKMCNIFDPKCDGCNLTPGTVCKGCCNSWSAWTNSFRLYDDYPNPWTTWTTTTTTTDSSWSTCTDVDSCADGCYVGRVGCQAKRTQECDNDPGSGCDCDEDSLILETKCCKKEDHKSIIYVYPIKTIYHDWYYFLFIGLVLFLFFNVIYLVYNNYDFDKQKQKQKEEVN